MLKGFAIILCSLIAVITLAYVIGSCNKQSDSFNRYIELPKPQELGEPFQNFSNNPLTDAGIELGRKLFYDGKLSIDGFHACASCHQQIGSFGTYEHDRSHGVYNSHTLRNAPPLINLAWHKTFHWDGEFSSLEDETMHPITGQTEMGETFERIIKKLQADPGYRSLFFKAFRIQKIQAIYIQKALSQFIRTIIVANSKFDRYKKGEVSFSTEEENGYALFKKNCASCHAEPLFTDESFRNIGLPVDPFLNDYGRMRITHLKNDSLKFRVPSLRNVYISSNYMHDGRFGTLAQCINHYRNNIQQSTTLDNSLKNGISMTDAEAANLFTFLITLTDSTVLHNKSWSDPE